MLKASRLSRILGGIVFLALFIPCGAEAAGPKRVLIVHSFGRDFAPYDTISSVFRTEVAGGYAEPVTFVEANLDFRRAANEKDEAAFVAYLRTRFDDAPPDLVVTIGPPAARFYVRHQPELFGATPTIIAALDDAIAQKLPLLPTDGVVSSRHDFPALISNILRLLPDTQTIAVVVGASELEQFWRAELQRQFAPFEKRVRFEWLNDLSLAQMQERVARLPPHSAIFYALFIVDAAGIPHERLDGLASLHTVANAPMFGIYEGELGKGVVGGPYTSEGNGGKRLAAAALRVLNGLPPRREFVVFETPVYDWRELKRWAIPTSRLPPDSQIRFKPPSLWETYRTAVIATTTAIVLQALLVTALLLQRAHRRRAELEATGLAGRIVTAHEDERRRLARELHDDVTQRLAGLAIEAAELELGTADSPTHDAVHSIREGLVGLSEDVHALSYRLHPSVIEDLGLVEALRIECDRIARQGELQVTFDCGAVPRKLPVDTAVCLFRVAQEALRNVERHAHANRIEVSVARADGGLWLRVSDDGRGFNSSRKANQPSLGLASMRERVRTLGGRFAIESESGAGTALSAWVPLAEAG